MPLDDTPRGREPQLLMDDDFAAPTPRGKVVGSPSPSGHRRLGADKEGVLSVDHGALRLSPLIVPGWGRAAVTYGPIDPQPGLGVSVLVLNAHNAADTLPTGPFGRRVARWLLGNRVDTLPARLLRWPGAPRREAPTRRLRRWWHRRRLEGVTPDESLAVGLFAAPGDGPSRGDHAFVVRTAGPANGELTVRVAGADLPVVASLQNLPMLYVVLVTASGTLYAVSSLAGAEGTAPYPLMRPLAIDASTARPPAYAGVQQRVVDQEGFSNDTRVYGIRGAVVAEAGAWCSTATAADRLTGEGPLDGRPAERGGRWDVVDGEVALGPDGLAGSGAAMLHTDVALGLVKVTVDLGDHGRAGLAWRRAGDQDLDELVLDRGAGLLAVRVGARTEQVPLPPPALGGPTLLQVCDTGRGLSVAGDGRHLVQLPDLSLPGPGDRIGIRTDAGARVIDFETHARAVPVPDLLRIPPPHPAPGARVVVDETFSSVADDLNGYSGDGDREWRRTSGSGRFEVDPDVGARAVATARTPLPSRTAYTIPWSDPTGADLAVTIRPPGSRRGEGHACRAGVVFVQDDRTHLIVNTWLDDGYGGASISSFPRLGGLEDVYDAVWTNVGDRISWGRPFELRVVFDGARFLASVDGEPVLYRAIDDFYPGAAPLRLTSVGLVTNWEWGEDTGSSFRRFTARALTQGDVPAT